MTFNRVVPSACAVLLTCLAMASATAQKTPAKEITQAQMQEAIDREMMTAVAGLMQSCKQLYPAGAGPLDARWAQEFASASPAMQAYMRTPAFDKAVATYRKAQLAQADTPEGARQLGALCASLADPSSE